MKFTAKLPETNVNVSQESLLKNFLLMLAGLAGIIVLAYAALGLAVDWVAPHVSYDMEHKIASSMLGGHPLLKDSRPAPPALQALADTVRRTATGIPYDVAVRVADMEMINAFALPGGNVVITSGLLEAVESENEITFILGHEMGHLAARDHLRGLGRGLVLLAFSQLLDGGGSLGDTLAGTLQLTDMSFSRAQETRADESGLEAMFAVHGHVAGIEDVFKHLGGKDYGYLTEFTLSHPESQKRVATLEALARERDYPLGELRPVPPGILPE